MSVRSSVKMIPYLIPVLSILVTAALIAAPVNVGVQTEIIGPIGSEQFGYSVTTLPNGNIVVTDPYYDAASIANVGAVYLYDGNTMQLISMLTGSNFGDMVGRDFVEVLADGNYIVSSYSWTNGSAIQAGAVTWCSGTSGCNGPVTPANSLVGTQDHDSVGYNVQGLSNGNYVVSSPSWANDLAVQAGAVTWCSGTSGCNGPVTPDNSLVGSQEYDVVGYDVQELSNSNYVIFSPSWSNGTEANAGAVTWCSGISGCTGPVTPANSLVGSHTHDNIGFQGMNGLSSGNYVLMSSTWDNGVVLNAGAVTWCSGTSGCTGEVTPTNSLVGSQDYDDIGSLVIELSNGNYVVISQSWGNVTQEDVSAVTWCSGTSGCTGEVTSTNSLVGSHVDDMVGLNVQVLSNGNYLVSYPYWNNDEVQDAGAVTWCSGTSGCTGPVTPANSLVGSQVDDSVGITNVQELSNGNYVVSSQSWDNGVVPNVGAVTWCSGTSGCTGPVTPANSLVGSHADDTVGYLSHAVGGIFPLINDNYVVSSPAWDNGAISSAGAATWCSGLSGCNGEVTSTNSLIGSQEGDQVGIGVTGLSNGHYVVNSQFWDNSAVINAGAATWCSGMSGCNGEVTSTNSLFGSQENDEVGYLVQELSNGNYVVRSLFWDNGVVPNAGAVTWCSGVSGCTGEVTLSNSLVGSQDNDEVGEGIFPLINGNYVVSSQSWDNGAISSAGAATWCSGTSGCTGPVTPANSLVGSHAGDHVGIDITGLSNGNYVVLSPIWNNGGQADAGAVTWGDGLSGKTIGPVTIQNSVLGETAFGGNIISFAYDSNNNHLIVGRPADNKVSVVIFDFKVYLPLVVR